ncbi:MAG: hypothetical protein BWK77_05650 [Verrucomicrobia bacterium A1]|nr:MAG: hypothetical protein BWK77_05650 [Verrucomicrobia bacterium A1]
MSERSTAVIVGAGSGVGRALADSLARRGFDLVVAARDARDVEAVAADLGLRYGVSVKPQVLDLAAADTDLDAWVSRCTRLLGSVGHVLITAGMVAPDDDGLLPDARTDQLVDINFRSVIRLVARFARLFEQQGSGRIVVFSSIAAAVPRRRNVAYSAAKAALEAYGRGLQHRFASGPVRLMIYAPGYVDTSMTFGQRLLFPLASPHAVAEDVVRHMARGTRFRYFPTYWSAVVAALRLLPWWVYKRLSF